jgi:hypothetical protein
VRKIGVIYSADGRARALRSPALGMREARSIARRFFGYPKIWVLNNAPARAPHRFKGARVVAEGVPSSLAAPLRASSSRLVGGAVGVLKRGCHRFRRNSAAGGR